MSVWFSCFCCFFRVIWLTTRELTVYTVIYQTVGERIYKIKIEYVNKQFYCDSIIFIINHILALWMAHLLTFFLSSELLMACISHFNAFIKLIVCQIWDYFYITFTQMFYWNSRIPHLLIVVFPFWKGWLLLLIVFKFIFVTNHYQSLVYHCVCPRFSLMVRISVISAVTECHNNEAFELHSEKSAHSADNPHHDFCHCCEYWEILNPSPLFFVFFFSADVLLLWCFIHGLTFMKCVTV